MFWLEIELGALENTSRFFSWIQDMASLWPNNSKYLSYKNTCMWAKEDKTRVPPKAF